MRRSAPRLSDLPPEFQARAKEAKREARHLEAERQRREFIAWCRAAGLPAPEPELEGIPGRKFRFDYAWPAERVVLEVEGAAFGVGKPCKECGQRAGGGHTRGAHFVKDIEKYNLATLAGWRVVRCTPENLLSIEVLSMLRGLIQGER